MDIICINILQIFSIIYIALFVIYFNFDLLKLFIRIYNNFS
jgi:hypothetical protein